MKNARIYKVAAALLALTQLVGCSAAGSADAPSTATSAVASQAAPAASEQAVASPAPTVAAPSANPLTQAWPVLTLDVTPDSAPFTVAADFSNLVNADELNFWSEDAKELLRKNGFLVCYADRSEFYENYEFNRYAASPNFVTVDALLHTYHLYYLYLQRGVEERELAPLLESLSTALLAESQTQWQALKGSEWENAALRNMAFFSVGASLLNPDVSVPAEAADLTAQELALIDAAADITLSPLMNANAAPEDYPVQEDYTQYKPRSYYTQKETLQRYFKAMMWYGRMSFLQSADDLNRSALLMNLALHDSGVDGDWNRIYDVTSFFSGASDDANYNDYAPLVEKAYGGWPHTEGLVGNTEGWDLWKAAAAELRPAAINSMPIYETDDRSITEHAYRFLGQRFSVDASIFAELTYRKVEKTDDDRARLLPDALDIPAALGSDLALNILNDEGLTDYPNYPAQLEKTRATFAAAPESIWRASLYAGWLNTLRPLTEQKGEGYPQFMQTEAWATHSLTSFLGSWAELKHDSALYAKQNYAEMGGAGAEERDDRGYVEAEPLVFGRLAALSQVTRNGLRELGMLSDADSENLTTMVELNTRLAAIAQKELTDELPTDEEFELIRSIGGQLEHFWTTVMADEVEKDAFFTPQQMPAALVADVSTDPNGSVLQVGTSVGTLYVIVNVDGKLRLASGSVFDFYQFEQPIADRMTDDDWWAALGMQPDANGGMHYDDKPLPVAWSSAYALPTTWGQ